MYRSEIPGRHTDIQMDIWWNIGCAYKLRKTSIPGGYGAARGKAIKSQNRENAVGKVRSLCRFPRSEETTVYLIKKLLNSELKIVSIVFHYIYLFVYCVWCVCVMEVCLGGCLLTHICQNVLVKGPLAQMDLFFSSPLWVLDITLGPQPRQQMPLLSKSPGWHRSIFVGIPTFETSTLLWA